MGFGGIALTAVSDLLEIIMQGDIQSRYAFNWQLNDYNMFELNLDGAKETYIAYYMKGKVHRYKCLVRGNKKLPVFEVFKMIMDALQDVKLSSQVLIERVVAIVLRANAQTDIPREGIVDACVPVLEFMLIEGWIRGSNDSSMPKRTFHSIGAAGAVHKHGKKDKS